jgi:hypothetical protein
VNAEGTGGKTGVGGNPKFGVGGNVNPIGVGGNMNPIGVGNDVVDAHAQTAGVGDVVPIGGADGHLVPLDGGAVVGGAVLLQPQKGPAQPSAHWMEAGGDKFK